MAVSGYTDTTQMSEPADRFATALCVGGFAAITGPFDIFRFLVSVPGLLLKVRLFMVERVVGACGRNRGKGYAGERLVMQIPQNRHEEMVGFLSVIPVAMRLNSTAASVDPTTPVIDRTPDPAANDLKGSQGWII